MQTKLTKVHFKTWELVLSFVKTPALPPKLIIQWIEVGWSGNLWSNCVRLAVVMSDVLYSYQTPATCGVTIWTLSCVEWTCGRRRFLGSSTARKRRSLRWLFQLWTPWDTATCWRNCSQSNSLYCTQATLVLERCVEFDETCHVPARGTSGVLLSLSQAIEFIITKSINHITQVPYQRCRTQLFRNTAFFTRRHVQG